MIVENCKYHYCTLKSVLSINVIHADNAQLSPIAITRCQL